MTDYPKEEAAGDLSARYTRKSRKCLMCKSAFSSEWSGERICPRCKGKNAWKNGIPGEAPYGR